LLWFTDCPHHEAARRLLSEVLAELAPGTLIRPSTRPLRGLRPAASALRLMLALVAVNTRDESKPNWRSWPSDRIVIEVSFDTLSDDDLEGMAGDAYGLGVLYADRERHATASALFRLADFANAELEDRTRGAKSLETTYWTSPVEFDPTSPPEHNKDDLGTVIARVIALADSEPGGPGYVWAKIASHLAKERDRLRREGVIL